MNVDDKLIEHIVEDQSSNDRKKLLAEARKRFLHLLLASQGKNISFSLYENTKVSGIFEGVDVGFENIAVSKLKTPIAIYESALIRVSDVISFQIDF
nr:gem-associated protein 7 [Hydra vulgaris]